MITDSLTDTLARAIVALEDAFDIVHGQRYPLTQKELADMNNLSMAIKLVQSVA